MSSVQNLLSDSKSRLSEKQDDVLSRFEVETVFMDVYSWTRTDMLLHLQDIVPNDKRRSRFISLINELYDGRPLAYVLGHCAFLDADYIVTQDVLIPRPETEELVQLLSEDLSQSDYESLVFVECGFGSGCVSLSLARRFPDALIFGWDISREALDIANKNKFLLDCQNAIFYNGDFFDGFSSFLKECESNVSIFIVSNPPYIAKKEMSSLDPSVLKYEPIEALTDYGDGLSFYKRIAEISDTRIKGVYCEFGESQGGSVASIFGEKADILQDMNGKNRFLRL